MKISRLYISPGHNFFGHHGQPPGQHSCIEVAAVECVAGRGIRGDRFFDYQADYKGQITFFSQEIFEQLCAALNLNGASPGLSRRNAVVTGANLNALIGQEFEVQGVRFRGMCECSPCYWMDSVYGPGTEAFLRGRGGLRARILTDGTLRVET